MDHLRSNNESGPSRRLVTSVVNQIAEEEPYATWIVAPASGVYRNLTYRQFSSAINGIA